MLHMEQVYDASGNTLYDGNNEYWYDAEGQLCAVHSQRWPGAAIIQYIYDAEGARIGKGTLASAPASYTATCAPPFGSGFTLTNRYLVDLGGDQVTELNGSGVWQHSNVWTGGKLVATYDTKGIHFELTDPLGTKRVQANAQGQVDETCTSLPFGNEVGNSPGANCVQPGNPLGTGDDATEHHFTGKERDSESGNDYFGARYYASSMGRFLSPDWAAKVTPVPYAKLDDPQSLNLYSYVWNNPLSQADADGHDGVILNDDHPGVAAGNGHNASVVGNDHDGWTYFSKDGYAAMGNQNHAEKFATFSDFQKSDYSARYTGAARMPTTPEQDAKMKEAGNKNFSKDFAVTADKGKNGKAENCADLTATVLGAGGIKIDKPQATMTVDVPTPIPGVSIPVSKTFTSPDLQYQGVLKNNPTATPVKPHCTGAGCS